MKKRSIILILICVLLFISACSNINKEETISESDKLEKEIIGTWTPIKTALNLGDTLIFKEDGTGTTDGEDLEWKLEENMLKVLYDGDVYKYNIVLNDSKIEFKEIYEYSFDRTVEAIRKEGTKNSKNELIGIWEYDDGEKFIELDDNGTGKTTSEAITKWTATNGTLEYNSIFKQDDGTECNSTHIFNYTINKDTITFQEVTTKAETGKVYIYEKF